MNTEELKRIGAEFIAELTRLIEEIGNTEPVPETKTKLLFKADFQNAPLTGIDKKAQFKIAFNNTGNISKVGDWWFEKGVLRTRIKKGEVGSDTTGVNGWASTASSPDTGHKELILRYVFIPRGPKKWGRGSKLPGLVVGRFGTTGGKKMDVNGGSARIMMKDGGLLYPYIYAHGKKGTFGTDAGTGAISKAVFDKENEIIIHVVMNTKSSPDGIMQVWHNGKLVCTLTDIIWQLEGNKDKGWDGIAIATFNGGEGEVFEMSEDAYVDITELEVSIPAK